uniref:Hsp90 co-chaperone Cdc37 n=1 Tax=Salmo salar TaxID=8030 RepID=B5XGY7_SALSA|nr:Hsp90 co-chaperone Cdc37 [Salmo salar]ADM15924.1 Hsp90 co-chaperone Cdc37 [Salmo salar]
MVDYSRWSKIEVSDDEDDTHPNIDTGSLFRWRHQARVERMEEFQARKDQLLRDKESVKEKLNQATLRYDQSPSDSADKPRLKALLDECKANYDEVIRKEADLLHEEKKQAWNIDTICREGFDSSIISSTKDQKEKEVDDYDGLTEFVEKYTKEIKTFGMLSDNAESRDYLLNNLYLVSAHTASYLCLWCIDLAVEEKWALFDLVTRQTTSMQFLMELANKISSPRNKLVDNFYSNMNKNLPEYNKYFNEELAAFQERAKGRADERLKEEIARMEAEEREKRLGPGGLDPVEVFEQLPKELQECFESRDLDLLKETLTQMPIEDANRYMQMCIDSGLWMADKNASDSAADDDDAPNEAIEEEK